MPDSPTARCAGVSGPRITFKVANVEPMTQVQLDMIWPLYGPLGISKSVS